MNRRDAIKALMALPATARVSTIDLHADDAIVIECDEAIRPEQAERMKRTLETVWPGRKCVVLGPGVRLRVLAATDKRLG
jgi:hypothetical protein